MPTRRTFISGSLAAGTLLAAGSLTAQKKPEKASKPLRILILGGTGFIGPHQVRYAVGRGHKVTVFNRGKTNPALFPDVEHLEGDRNGKLDALRNREWDAVIDNPATLPRWVRDSAQLLKEQAGQYVFISTLSVYKDNSKVGMDESDPVATLADPAVEQITGETLRRIEGARRTGSAESFRRSRDGHPPRTDRRPRRQHRPVHVLAGPDRARRGRPGTGRSEQPRADHRRPRSQRMDDPCRGERDVRNDERSGTCRPAHDGGDARRDSSGRAGNGAHDSALGAG